MKKVVLLTIMWFVYVLLHSQDYYTTGPNVYTCKNGVIETIKPNRELNSQELADIDYNLFNPNGAYFSLGITKSDIVSAPSSYYNCHAYAWYLTEGNTNKVWINQYTQTNTNNLSKFWDTNYGCFVETTSEASAEKIFYYSGNHSAVKSSVAGKYESKWGSWYVIRHNPDSVPYVNPKNRRYYVKTPTISGPSEMCSNSTATFSVSPPNSIYTWTCSSNLTAEEGFSHYKNFTANGNGQAWVAVSIDGNEVFRFYVWLGVPSVNVSYDVVGRVVLPPGTLIQPTDVFIGDTVLFHSNAQPTTASVTWTSTAMQYSPNGSANIYYIFQDGGGLSGYNIKATATNSCGSTSSTLNLYPSPVPIKKLATSYPNPVSDVLNITIDASASQNQSRQQGSADTKSLQTAATTYDVRLYNRHGRLLRQATTQGDNVVQFNVTHLRDGIYYLHIYDGVGNKPEIHQIMVKH